MTEYTTIEDCRPYTFKSGCPVCGRLVEYWKSSGMSMMFPHFYCNRCHNPYWREKDQRAIYELKTRSEVQVKISSILKELPKCSCGGSFTLDGGPVHPCCGHNPNKKYDFMNRVYNPNVYIFRGTKLGIERLPKEVKSKATDESPTPKNTPNRILTKEQLRQIRELQRKRK